MPNTPTVPTQQDERQAQLKAGGSFAAIVPADLNQVFRLAQAVAVAGLAPYGMQRPEQITVAILQGLEVDLPPMQAIQNIAVINGRATMWGDALLGVVRASPACEYIKEWIEGEGDARVAYCETRRRGEKEPVRRKFSVTDAVRAGLWQTEARVQRRKKDGGGTYETDNDSPWWKYPERMLQMRARAWCLRDVYADVLKGLYVREEVEDYAFEQARDVTPPPASNMDALAARLQASQMSGEGIAARVGGEVDEIRNTESGAPAAPDDGADLSSPQPSNQAVKSAPSRDDASDGGSGDDPSVVEGVSIASALEALHEAMQASNEASDLDETLDAFELSESRGDALAAGRRIYSEHRNRLTGKLTAEKCNERVGDIIASCA